MQHLLDANPQIGHIFQNIVRGLMHQQAPPPDHEPSLPGDDPDLADLPPLEPIPNPPAPGQQDIIDREMTPADGIQSVGSFSEHLVLVYTHFDGPASRSRCVTCGSSYEHFAG